MTCRCAGFVPSAKISAMFPLLRHLIGWIVSAFGSRHDLILENLASYVSSTRLPPKDTPNLTNMPRNATAGRARGHRNSFRFSHGSRSSETKPHLLNKRSISTKGEIAATSLCKKALQFDTRAAFVMGYRHSQMLSERNLSNQCPPV